MKKILLFLALLSCITLQAQVEFDLMPANIQNYIGKVNREQFEKIVGDSTDYEDIGFSGDRFILYNVINFYSKDETTIRCFYRKTDGKLITVRFSARHYSEYIKGFKKVKGYINERRNILDYFIPFTGEHRISCKVQGLGLQMSDINRDEDTALLHYFNAKL